MMATLQGTYFQTCYDSGLEKLKRFIDTDSLRYAQETSRFFCLSGDDKETACIDGRVLDTLLLAMEESRAVEIVRWEKGTHAEMKCTFYPYGILYHRGWLGAFGKLPSQNGIDLYDVRLLRSIRLKNEKYVRPETCEIPIPRQDNADS